MQLLFYRCLLGLIPVSVSLIAQRKHAFGPQRVRFWVIIRGVICFPALSIYFLSLEWLPIANAVTVFSTSSCWALLINRIFLKEPFGIVHSLCVLLSIIGATLVARPSFLFGEGDQHEQSKPDWWVYLMAMGGAIVMGSQFLPMIQAGRLGSFNSEMLFSFNIGGMLAGLVLMFCIPSQAFVIPPYVLSEWGAILAVAVGGLVVQATFNYASERLEGNIVSLLTTAESLWAYVWQAAFFSEPTPWLALLGGSLIVLSVSLVSVHRIFTTRATQRKISQTKEIPEHSVRLSTEGRCEEKIELVSISDIDMSTWTEEPMFTSTGKVGSGQKERERGDKQVGVRVRGETYQRVAAVDTHDASSS